MIRKGNKDILIGKKERKLSLFTDDMIVSVSCRKYQRINKKIILKLKSNYNKVAEYAVNIQRSVAFYILATNKFRNLKYNTIYFSTPQKRIGIDLTNKYKTYMRKPLMKEILNKWRDFPRTRRGKHNLL